MSETALDKNQTTAMPRVMVVDDEYKIRDILFELLDNEGIDVVTASGGTECLRLLRDGFLGVILMDIMMPGMDGWDTIREIREAGLLEGNIIAMLTALYEPDEKMDGLQEVVIDYIVKPFEPDQLIDTVRKYFSFLEQAQQAAE